MSATVVIVLLWLAFAATHTWPSSPGVRERLVARLGENLFLGLYSLVSLVLFVPLFGFYLRHRHGAPMLWTVPMVPPLRELFGLAALAATALALLGLMQPSPASIAPGPATVRGVARLTRHPLFMGLGLIGLLHLVPNGSTADVAFFGGLPLFAVAGCRHQDARKLASGLRGYREYVAATPFLPFTGGETLRGLREIGAVRLAIALAGAVLIRALHPTLFG